MKLPITDPKVCCVLAAVAALITTLRADAATYYWDTNGTAAGIGSVSTPVDWLTNSWAIASTGNAATSAWPNTQLANADIAAFNGTAGTVNISSDVYANGVRFEPNNQTPNYLIASTGGVLKLVGTSPTVTVNLALSSDNVTISAPITGTNGWTLGGNSLTGGFKFLVLANNSATTPNSFSGTLTIAAGGALRIGGAMDREQIPDDVDLNVVGVIDFVTNGGASDMKQEKVRDVTVDGAGAIFSVGNGTDFVVNSISGTNATNISVNGNQATVPGRLIINGWSDGNGDLTLNSSLLKLNTTSGTSAIGGRVVLSGDITSTGASQIINNNGRASSVDTNTFANKAFDFAGTAHTINVADGTLTFASTSANHPLEITTTQPGGAVVTKTGVGTLVLQNAVQTNFAGATKVQEGVLSLSNPSLADAADLYLSSGATLNLNFPGTDAIKSLYFDGVSKATGTWGRLGHPTADFPSGFLTGDGLLNVTTFVPPLLIGDFNDDKTVDAADYTVWRNHLGEDVVLPNDLTPGMVTSEDYVDWKSNFGMSSGSGGMHVGPAPVPEAGSAVLILLAVMTSAAIIRLRRRSQHALN